jgi:transcriptional regulator with XRE-family HTH domain
MTRWWDYVTRIAGDVTQTEIAEHAGIEQSSVSRWKKGASRPDWNLVIQFAESYGHEPVEALVEAGLLPEGSVRIVKVERPASDLSNEELAREVQRRLEPRPDAPPI